MKGNAAAIVQDANDATDGVTIFCKLVKAYEQSDGHGTVYLLQLKEFTVYEAGSATVFPSKFVAICNDCRNTTGSEIPTGIQWTSLLGALRTHNTNSIGGATLAAHAPDAFTPLHQSTTPQKLSANEMLRMLGMTCENILSTDP